MSIDSTSGREAEVVSWLDGYLADRGWRTLRIPVSPGRDDVYATASDSPLVTLTTHLDTVPPYIPPRRDGEKLYGRGACDAKGIAASMICAAECLREAGVPVALLFVVGEEVTHDGAHAANAAIASGLVPRTNRVIIDGEPTESTLAVGTKGAIRVTIRTRGHAAHSAYPHLGHSATRDLVRLLAEVDAIALPTDELFGPTTVNIGVLHGRCSGQRRRAVGRGAADDSARHAAGGGEVDHRAMGWEIAPSSSGGRSCRPIRLGVVDGFPTSVAAFATDIPALTNWGKPYLFGPGSIHVAHRDDECVSLDELEAAVGAYERIAMASLAASDRDRAGLA